MTYSFDQHVFSAGASGGSTTSAIDTTADDLIVCGIVYTNAPTLSDNKGNTWTEVGNPGENSNQEGVKLFFCSNPIVGPGHTFTVAGAGTFSSVFVLTFKASGSASSPDQHSGAFTNAASTSLATGSITPSQPNAVICVMYGNEGSAASQALDSGMTVTDTQGISGPAWGSCMGYKIQTSAAAINVTGSTAANGTNSIIMAAFILGGGGGGGGSGGGGTNRIFPVTSARSFPSVAQRQFPVN